MRNGVNIALLCATQRGYLFLQKLKQLLPDSRLTVFSFRESLHEPPYFFRIRDETEAGGHRFVEARKVDAPEHSGIWAQTAFDLLLAVSWRYLVPEKIFRRASRGAFVF